MNSRMESTDCFYTIKIESKTEIKIKGSKFISQAIPCANEIEAEEILGSVRNKYHDATHHCFAYRVGVGKGMKSRYSDAGEPSGTAGRPIFDQIKGRELTNLIVVVTRYFGGIKLGTGGLTHAYSDSGREAIEKAGIIEKYIVDRVAIVVQFSDYNSIERLIHRYEAKVLSSDFTDIVRLTTEMRLSRIDEFKKSLIDATSGRVTFDQGT